MKSWQIVQRCTICWDWCLHLSPFEQRKVFKCKWNMQAILYIWFHYIILLIFFYNSKVNILYLSITLNLYSLFSQQMSTILIFSALAFEVRLEPKISGLCTISQHCGGEFFCDRQNLCLYSVASACEKTIGGVLLFLKNFVCDLICDNGYLMWLPIYRYIAYNWWFLAMKTRYCGPKLCLQSKHGLCGL